MVEDDFLLLNFVMRKTHVQDPPNPNKNLFIIKKYKHRKCRKAIHANLTLCGQLAYSTNITELDMDSTPALEISIIIYLIGIIIRLLSSLHLDLGLSIN